MLHILKCFKKFHCNFIIEKEYCFVWLNKKNSNVFVLQNQFLWTRWKNWSVTVYLRVRSKIWNDIFVSAVRIWNRFSLGYYNLKSNPTSISTDNIIYNWFERKTWKSNNLRGRSCWLCQITLNQSIRIGLGRNRKSETFAFTSEVNCYGQTLQVAADFAQGPFKL